MTKRSIFVSLLAAVVIAALALTGCSPKQETPAEQTQPAATESAQATPPAETTAPVPAQPAEQPEPAKLVIKDKKVGKGAAAKAGDLVTVNYTGWLTDGTQFDSSIGKKPYQFLLGAGRVIPGWDQGVVGMKVGGIRRLTIPSDLGYGPSGNGPIPPGATLLFEIEMLKIN